MKPNPHVEYLIRSFPCLADKAIPIESGTADRFDVLAWDRLSRTWNSAERCAALFVATVWDPYGPHAGQWKFDFVEAVLAWSEADRSAFIDWTKEPYWL